MKKKKESVKFQHWLSIGEQKEPKKGGSYFRNIM